jgi:hypothetical protein
MGGRRFLLVLCGCERSVLVRVRGLRPSPPREMEPHLAIDGVRWADWRNDFREAMVEVGDAPWDEFVGAGRRPSFDGWSARCGRADCSRVVKGHIDDLVEFVRAAIESGDRSVVLTSETLSEARRRRERRDVESPA